MGVHASDVTTQEAQAGKQEFKAGLCLKSMKTETKQLPPFTYNLCEFTSIFIIIVVINRI